MKLIYQFQNQVVFFYLSTSEVEIDDSDTDLSEVGVWNDIPSAFVSPVLPRFPFYENPGPTIISW